jgi:hypothetical protein
VLDTLAEPDSKSESRDRQPAVVLAAVKDRPSARPQGSSLTPRCARRPHPSCGPGRKNGSPQGPNKRIA